MLFWDVNNGIARRAWGTNDNAVRSNAASIFSVAVSHGSLNLVWWLTNPCSSLPARQEHAIRRAMEINPTLKVTLPYHADDTVLEKALGGQ